MIFYQRHCRFYCFMRGEKRLDFHAFAAKSVLLLHARGKKTRLPRFCGKIGLIATCMGKKTQLSHFYDKIGLIKTHIEKKDSTFTLLRQNPSYYDTHRKKRLNFHAFAPI